MPCTGPLGIFIKQVKLPRRHIAGEASPHAVGSTSATKRFPATADKSNFTHSPYTIPGCTYAPISITPGVGLTYQKLFPLLAVPVRNPRAGAICATFNIFSISSFPAYVKNKNRPSALAEGRGIRHIIQLHIHQRHSMTNRHECIGYANKQPPAKHIRLHFQD